MAKQIFTVGYMQNGSDVESNSWYGDSAWKTLTEARLRAETLSKQRGILAAGAWPSHHWNLGHPTCKPRVLFDNTDYSDALIRNCAARAIINSASSTIL